MGPRLANVSRLDGARPAAPMRCRSTGADLTTLLGGFGAGAVESRDIREPGTHVVLWGVSVAEPR